MGKGAEMSDVCPAAWTREDRLQVLRHGIIEYLKVCGGRTPAPDAVQQVARHYGVDQGHVSAAMWSLVDDDKIAYDQEAELTLVGFPLADQRTLPKTIEEVIRVVRDQLKPGPTPVTKMRGILERYCRENDTINAALLWLVLSDRSVAIDDNLVMHWVQKSD